MDSQCTLAPTGSLQDWFTDPDSWICRFNANVSRLHPKRDDANLDQKCKNCCREPKNAHIDHITTHKSAEPPVTLHEIIVNGLLIAQKRKDTFTNKADFLNIFRGNDDFTHYDYALLTTVKNNGRKYVQKYIRSKI